MDKSRVFRSLVCLLLVCCLCFNMAMIPVRATGLVESAIVGLSSVSVPGVLVVGATLVALGIMAYGAETGAWENLAYQATEFLEDTGEWIQDGSMEVMKAVTAAGETTYYAAGELFETLRSWAWDSGTVSYDLQLSNTLSSDAAFQAALNSVASYPYSCLVVAPSGDASLVRTNDTLYLDEQNVIRATGSGYLWVASAPGYSNWVAMGGYGVSGCAISFMKYGKCISPTTPYDLSLGVIAEAAIDYNRYPDAYADYMRSQLRVINTGGGQNPDSGGNGWKWFLPLALAGTLTQIAGSTQEQQWTAETPEEFPEGDTVTEFEILDTPEIDGLPGLEVSPSTGSNPDSGSDPSTDPTTAPGTDPGTGTNPGTGTDPGTGTNPGTGTDPGTGTNPDSGSDTEPGTDPETGPVLKFFVDLAQFFPFCIPYDIYKFFEYLVAEPVAPVFHWEIQDLAGNVYEIDIDLSPWDSFAALFRDLQLILYIFGLMMLTRKFIKW